MPKRFWLLGLVHASRTGVERANVLVLRHLKFGVESRATYSLTVIGNIYEEGVHDIIKAAEFYRQGSDEEGYAVSQSLLRELQLNSDFVIILPVRAAVSFSKAALQEHPEALASLATQYFDGQTVDKNPPGADDLFALDAIAGNSAAALRLAEMHERGGGIPVNANEAAFYYIISAELENTDDIAPATVAKKSMTFHVARQNPFNNQINGWFSEHGHTAVA